MKETGLSLDSSSIQWESCCGILELRRIPNFYVFSKDLGSYVECSQACAVHEPMLGEPSVPMTMTLS